MPNQTPFALVSLVNRSSKQAWGLVGKEEEGQGGGRWKGEEARKGEWTGVCQNKCMNAVFDWLASLKWAIIAGLLSSSGACGKPGPGQAEMSGCSTEKTSWLNNKQCQEASIQRDTASCFGGSGVDPHKSIKFLLHSFVEILRHSAVYDLPLQNHCTDRKPV